MGQTLPFSVTDVSPNFFQPQQQKECSFRIRWCILTSRGHFRSAVCNGLNRSGFCVSLTEYMKNFFEKSMGKVLGSGGTIGEKWKGSHKYYERSVGWKTWKTWKITHNLHTTRISSDLYTWLTGSDLNLSKYDFEIWRMWLCSFCYWGWEHTQTDVYIGKRQSLERYLSRTGHLKANSDRGTNKEMHQLSMKKN